MSYGTYGAVQVRILPGSLTINQATRLMQNINAADLIWTIGDYDLRAPIPGRKLERIQIGHQTLKDGRRVYRTEVRGSDEADYANLVHVYTKLQTALMAAGHIATEFVRGLEDD